MAAMGPFEYPHYYFLNMVVEASGGLEHKNSFLTMSNRFVTRNRGPYINWLSLAAHEYFHNWNIKRLRPAELGPFDYETENYTRSLWVAEGVTDYYGALLVRRAGLTSTPEYLDMLSGSIEAVQTRPGRRVQSAEMASFDTWIKQYRPDENSANTSIDYYDKGATIAFLLDARIRKASGGARTLDDAMRLAYKRYSGAKGFTPEEFQKAMSETAGADLSAWFAQVLTTTEELDFTEALDWFGLRFTPVDPRGQRPTTGLVTRNDNGRLVVTGVRRNTPGYEAGLNVDDEILAVDDLRVRADGLAARLDQYRAGDTVRLLVARRDRLMTIPVTLAADAGRPWRLQPLPEATPEQQKRLTAWLGRIAERLSLVRRAELQLRLEAALKSCPTYGTSSRPARRSSRAAPRQGRGHHIVSRAAIETMPVNRWPRRRFSFSPCWLLSKFTIGSEIAGAPTDSMSAAAPGTVAPLVRIWIGRSPNIRSSAATTLRDSGSSGDVRNAFVPPRITILTISGCWALVASSGSDWVMKYPWARMWVAIFSTISRAGVSLTRRISRAAVAVSGMIVRASGPV